MMGTMTASHRGAPEPMDLWGALTPGAQDLTRALDGAPIAALDDWEWLSFADHTPAMRSWIGDVFFVGHDGIWLLDVVEGTFERQWVNPLDLAVALADDDGQDRYLLGGLVIGARNRGLVPSPTESYAFAPPPVLGGDVDLDHVKVIDHDVHLSTTGQIFTQVRNLPPGTPIIGLT